MALSLTSRYRGSLLGLACGDALGTTFEFKPPGTFDPITDIVGGGPFRLEPGQWTDDTSMALCLAASLVEKGGFDPRDQMDRYLRWRRHGYMSSTGESFDVGRTVSNSLGAYRKSGNPFSGPTEPRSAGNGSLMRLAPIPLFFGHDPRQAISRAGDSSRTTHGAAEAVDACRYFAGLIVGALQERPRDELLAELFTPVAGLWQEEPLSPRIAEVASGSFKRKQPPDIQGTGYVVESLEAALWAFHNSESFHDGVLLAVNLGDDADTTGAVFGQLAGAYYGEEGIPERWRLRIVKRDLILGLAGKLFELRIQASS
jgi:ADP-ribosylglycohydrolase